MSLFEDRLPPDVIQTPGPEIAPPAVGTDAFVVDILRARILLAAFTCPVEAFRFAALIHEPGSPLLLRRRADGAVKPFSPRSAATVLSWLAAGPEPS